MAFLLALALLPAGQPSVVRSGEIRSLVASHVAKCYPAGGDSAVVEFRAVPDSIVLPARCISMAVGAGTHALPAGNVTIPVQLDCADGQVRGIAVSVKVRVFGSVCVLKTAKDRHGRVDSSDVAVERREVTALPADRLHDAGVLSGVRTRHSLREGTVLAQNMLEPLPAVTGGRPVTVIVRGGAVRLTTQGIARQDGRVGDVIDVQRIHSHERVRARVLDEKSVLVETE
jgi:flagella basal body P-ring formation protein FlgA